MAPGASEARLRELVNKDLSARVIMKKMQFLTPENVDLVLHPGLDTEQSREPTSELMR